MRGVLTRLESSKIVFSPLGELAKLFQTPWSAGEGATPSPFTPLDAFSVSFSAPSALCISVPLAPWSRPPKLIGSLRACSVSSWYRFYLFYIPFYIVHWWLVVGSLLLKWYFCSNVSLTDICSVVDLWCTAWLELCCSLSTVFLAYCRLLLCRPITLFSVLHVHCIRTVDCSVVFC